MMIHFSTVGRQGRVEDLQQKEVQKYRLAETKERIPLLSSDTSCGRWKSATSDRGETS